MAAEQKSILTGHPTRLLPVCLVGGLGLLLLDQGVAHAGRPARDGGQPRSWVIEAPIDGGTCSGGASLEPSGCACRVGMEAEIFVVNGVLHIYDSFGGGLVACGDTIEICGTPFRCDCRPCYVEPSAHDEDPASTSAPVNKPPIQATKPQKPAPASKRR